MTACVNDNQKKGGYGKAVSATLAGVLAVGMVPATALAADGNQAVASEDGIQLLDGTTLKEAFAGGYVSEAAMGAITKGTTPSFVYNGNVQELAPTQVTMANGQTVEITDKNFTVTEASNPVAINAGTYSVTIAGKANTDYAGCTLTANYKITPVQLSTVKPTPYVVGAGGQVTSDTPTYSVAGLTVGTQPGNVWFKDANGNALPGNNTDFAVNTKTSATIKPTALSSKITLSGSATGTSGNYQGTVQVALQIKPFDISSLGITGYNLAYNNTWVWAEAHPTTNPAKPTLGYDGTLTATDGDFEWMISSINGTGATESAGDGDWATLIAALSTSTKQAHNFKGSYIDADKACAAMELQGSEQNTEDDSLNRGTYNFTLSSTGESDLVIGSTTFTVNVTTATPAVSYLSDPLKPATQNGTAVSGVNIYTDLSAKTPKVFDSANLTSTGNGVVPIPNANLTVKAYDANTGAEVNNSALTQTPGSYNVVVTGVNATTGDNAYASSTYGYMTVNVTKGFVNWSNYDLSNTNNTYSGTAANFGNVDVTTGKKSVFITYDGTLVQNVTATANGSDIVSQIKVAVQSVDGATLTEGTDYTLTYTDGTGKKVTSITQPGIYTGTIQSLGTYEPVEFNGTAPTKNTFTITVTKASTAYKDFIDVRQNAWYYNDVEEAFENGYVRGYNGGDLFGPNDDIKRGDVAMILARMGGVKLTADDDEITETHGYTTPFKDVDPNMYWAQAIAWCASNEIITGYGNTGEFRPSNPVTREEFATMLARYAKRCGTDIAAADSVLSSYTDANKVSSWAKPFVAWTVADEIMGVNTKTLAPANRVTRAQVAAMAVRCQPKSNYDAAYLTWWTTGSYPQA